MKRAPLKRRTVPPAAVRDRLGNEARESISLEHRYEIAQDLLAELIRRVELVEGRCYDELTTPQAFEDTVHGMRPMIALLNDDGERISIEAIEWGILDVLGDPVRFPKAEGGAA